MDARAVTKMDNERLIAPKYKRLAAFLLDFVLVFMLWYFMTKGNLKQVDTLMETLDPAVDGALDVFVQALFQMLTAFLLKWLFCQTLYFCILPAILGNASAYQPLGCRNPGRNVSIPTDASRVGRADIAGNSFDHPRNRQLVYGFVFKKWKEPAGPIGEHHLRAGHQLSGLIWKKYC